MLFQSSGFLFVFLPLFLICLRLAPKGAGRGCCVLFFSYVFYSGNEPGFLLILIFTSLLDYVAALAIDRSTARSVKKVWLAASIVANLGLLGFFKYGGMIWPSLAQAGAWLGWRPVDPNFFQSFILPAGISFYTFQSMSYTIDVYRGQVKPENNLLIYLDYVAYLPQLIAGPIERFGHLYPQLKELAQGRTKPQWTAGLDRLALGVAEKLLLADSCGRIVDALVLNGGPYTFLSGWAVAIGFGMQIFFDFAAYTNMAIGIGLLVGVRLTENFLSPYQSPNIQEFWRRWHLTLSGWFRDYLYFPLGGSRGSLFRTFLNTLLTFMLCGLWHGAGWNFVAWGTAHGVLVGGYHVLKRKFPATAVPKAVAIAVTFMLVHIIWVLFRVNDANHVLDVWRGMFGLSGWQPGGVAIADLIFLTLVTAATLFLPNAAQRWPGRSGWLESWAWWGVAVWAVFNSPQINQFIYFQF